jgi:hypothetical protein
MVKVYDDLIGKVVKQVDVMDKERVIFTLEDDTRWIMYHEQDCCETVWLDDVCGDWRTILDSPIVMAEETIQTNTDDWGESQTFTFYKFATVNGYITLMWKGMSNGYYSETVSFHQEVN